MASKVLDNIEKFSDNLQKSLTPSNKSVNVSYLVSGLLIVYAVLVAPMLPVKSLNFLKHTWVRVVLIILISLVCLVSPVNALLLAICFVVTLQRLSSSKKQDENKAINNK